MFNIKNVFMKPIAKTKKGLNQFSVKSHFSIVVAHNTLPVFPFHTSCYFQNASKLTAYFVTTECIF